MSYPKPHHPPHRLIPTAHATAPWREFESIFTHCLFYLAQCYGNKGNREKVSFGGGVVVHRTLSLYSRHLHNHFSHTTIPAPGRRVHPADAATPVGNQAIRPQGLQWIHIASLSPLPPHPMPPPAPPRNGPSTLQHYHSTILASTTMRRDGIFWPARRTSSRRPWRGFRQVPARQSARMLRKRWPALPAAGASTTSTCSSPPRTYSRGLCARPRRCWAMATLSGSTSTFRWSAKPPSSPPRPTRT